MIARSDVGEIRVVAIFKRTGGVNRQVVSPDYQHNRQMACFRLHRRRCDYHRVVFRAAQHKVADYFYRATLFS